MDRDLEDRIHRVLRRFHKYVPPMPVEFDEPAPVRAKPRERAETKAAAIRKLLSEGIEVPDIAVQVRCSRHYVHNTIARHRESEARHAS